MKTIVKISLMLNLLLLTSLAGSGQKHLFMNASSPLASYSSENSYRLDLIGYSTDTYRTNTEDEMPLRDWMTEGSSWQRAGIARLARALILEEESPMQLQEWMIRPLSGMSGAQIRLSELIKVEQEVPIKLQKWMICCTDWRNSPR